MNQTRSVTKIVYLIPKWDRMHTLTLRPEDSEPSNAIGSVKITVTEGEWHEGRVEQVLQDQRRTQGFCGG